MKRIKITENQAKLLGITKPSKQGTVIKITLEQYNRIFSESLEVTGGLDRVPKRFQKETKKVTIKNFTNNDIKNESKPFKIKDANNKIGSNTKMKPSKREEPIIFETEDIENAPEKVEDPHPAEVAELLKYLYRKSDKLSPYWEQNGLSHDSITNTLLGKGMLVKKNGTHQLSKSLGDPKTAVKTVEEELRKHIKPVVGEISKEIIEPKEEDNDEPRNEVLFDNGELSVYKENDELYAKYNTGVNEEDEFSNPGTKIDGKFKEKLLRYHDKDKKLISVLDEVKDEVTGPIEVTDEELMDTYPISELPATRAEVNWSKRGVDGWGEVQIKTNTDAVTNYFDKESLINDLNKVRQKYGEVIKFRIDKSQPWFKNIEITNDKFKVDADTYSKRVQDYLDAERGQGRTTGLDEEQSEERKAELNAIIKAKRDASKIEDDKRFAKRDAENAINSKKALTKMRMTAKGERAPKAPDVEKKDPPAPDFFGTPYDEVMEMNTGMPGATGMFVGPFGAGKPDMVSRDINKPKVKVVKEVTAGPDSVGPYDANALNIAGDGTFKKGKKTEAEKTPQIKNGSFVKLNSCVKLNNNKSAQNGKCNQGDSGVVSYSKTAPSSLYEVIAKKTGKTIEEVKRIIESKNAKA